MGRDGVTGHWATRRKAKAMTCTAVSRAVVLFVMGAMQCCCFTGEPDVGEFLPQLIEMAGGKIQIGRPQKGNRSWETHSDEPQLIIGVDAFWVSKYPITAQQFSVYLNAKIKSGQSIGNDYVFDANASDAYQYSTLEMKNGHVAPRLGAERAPVNRVTWLGSVGYCEWLSDKLRGNFRLPTEAEWEYMARGKEGRIWPWGDSDPNDENGLRWKRIEFDEREPWTKTPIGSFPKNSTPQGVCDVMSYYCGEWCLTKYTGKPSVQSLSDKRILIEDKHSPRVVRGVYHKKVEYALPWESSWHEGRTWTRGFAHPTQGPRESARFTFRIVSQMKYPDETSQDHSRSNSEKIEVPVAANEPVKPLEDPNGAGGR